MIETASALEESWIEQALASLLEDGVFVLTDVLSENVCSRLLEASIEAQRLVVTEIGRNRLEEAGEIGVVRMPIKQSDHFLILVDNEPVNALVDRFISPSAICHLMNAILLPARMSNDTLTFQSRFHRDFPRFTGGMPLSLNSFYCLTEFRPANGSTKFLMRSHQGTDLLADTSQSDVQQVAAPIGSAVLFDSTIWHAGGINTSDEIRVGVNVQWTHHWIKQQIDVVRYLGFTQEASLSDRLMQRLGYNSQVVTSLQEYYVPSSARIYRAGQG
jgi:ectoine hydroxylase-related dioxygenase (phytanoyl-CoA dioxygenase family)